MFSKLSTWAVSLSGAAMTVLAPMEATANYGHEVFDGGYVDGVYGYEAPYNCGWDWSNVNGQWAECPDWRTIYNGHFPRVLAFDDYYENGFWFEGPCRNLRVGGWVRPQLLGFTNRREGLTTFTVDIANLFAMGRIYDWLGVRLEIVTSLAPTNFDHDFDLGDAFIETLCPHAIRFRFGLFKEPFGLEHLISDRYRLFTQPGLAFTNLLYFRDLGLMAFGSVFDERVNYAVGVFNGRGDSAADLQSKEWVTRVVLAPFLCSEWCCARHFYLGGSLSWRRVGEGLAVPYNLAFAVPNALQFFGTGPVAGNLGAGESLKRYEADAEWFCGPYTLRSEYMFIDGGDIQLGSSNPVETANFFPTFRTYTWYVEGAYMLTGEEREHNSPIIPCRDFNPCCWGEGWGAWEVAARYESFRVSNALNEGLSINPPFKLDANRASSVSVATNWYINPDASIKLAYHYYTFNRPVTGATIVATSTNFQAQVRHQNMIILAAQLEF